MLHVYNVNGTHINLFQIDYLSRLASKDTGTSHFEIFLITGNSITINCFKHTGPKIYEDLLQAWDSHIEANKKVEAPL